MKILCGEHVLDMDRMNAVLPDGAHVWAQVQPYSYSLEMLPEWSRGTYFVTSDNGAVHIGDMAFKIMTDLSAYIGIGRMRYLLQDIARGAGCTEGGWDPAKVGENTVMWQLMGQLGLKSVHMPNCDRTLSNSLRAVKDPGRSDGDIGGLLAGYLYTEGLSFVELHKALTEFLQSLPPEGLYEFIETVYGVLSGDAGQEVPAAVQQVQAKEGPALDGSMRDIVRDAVRAALEEIVQEAVRDTASVQEPSRESGDTDDGVPGFEDIEDAPGEDGLEPEPDSLVSAVPSLDDAETGPVPVPEFQEEKPEILDGGDGRTLTDAVDSFASGGSAADLRKRMKLPGGTGLFSSGRRLKGSDITGTDETFTIEYYDKFYKDGLEMANSEGFADRLIRARAGEGVSPVAVLGEAVGRVQKVLMEQAEKGSDAANLRDQLLDMAADISAAAEKLKN